ncbi:MAG: rhamnogalacturonan acetylesterase [Saprospiraceae bacterium]
MLLLLKNSFSSLLLLLISFVALGTPNLSAQTDKSVSIFLIGDSTMADKPDTPDKNPERGWGQLLSTFFKEEVTIHNHAVNGRSSKSFIGEGRWEKVLADLNSGDYVFIQFGHNDQKYKNPHGYTNPWTAYRRNLEKFVKETQQKGAHPILLSSIVRRKFNEYGTLVDTHGLYPFVSRTVAEHLQVPFIDMQLLTEDYINDLGVEPSKDIYLWIAAGVYKKLPDGLEDNTHLSLKGATAYARLVTESILQQELPLAAWLKEKKE